MLQIIHEVDDPDLMARVWAFRHRRFVEQMGWKELARDNNLERDQFDTSTTLHLVLEHNREVVGYSRLLPTTGPHLVKAFLPASIKAPYGPGIYEWSRCATALDSAPIAGLPVGDILMIGVLECLISLGADAISFLTYPAVVRMMRRRGYPARVIADIAVPNGDHVQAVFSPLTAELLARQRQAAGIEHSLVTWGRHVSRLEDCETKAA
jgi:acyl-homoserine lactone synthase